jgi:serine/threonine protein kinase
MKDAQDNDVQHDEVIDEYDTSYKLKNEIGFGGQGSVRNTQYDKILVKRLRGGAPEQRSKTYRRLRYLMLRDDLPLREISVPKGLLKDPDYGYVMELMDEMIPIAELLTSPVNCNSPGKLVAWYRTSGAIRRRVFLLHRLSRILVDIHSKGFVFGDLSPANIFISEDPNHDEVQLIDCDNLVLLSECESGLHTPRYAAPELVRGDSVHTSLTDAYSFASIAYELLTLHHPLLGDMVHNGDPELEEQAFRGELPWVEDQEDDRNVRTDGFPSEKVIFSALRNLIVQTFAGGRNAWKRPGMQEWHAALESVIHGFLKCDDCGAYFIYHKDYSCPFCEKHKNKENAVILRFRRWEPRAGEGQRIFNPTELKLPRMILNKGEQIEIPSSLHFHERGSLRFSLEDNGLYVELMGEQKRKIVIRKVGGDIDEGQSRTLTEGHRLSISPKGGVHGYCIHFGELDEPHRIITFVWGKQ